MKGKKAIYPTIIVLAVAVLTALVSVYFASPASSYSESDGRNEDLAGVMAALAFLSLGFIYARSFIKIASNSESFWNKVKEYVGDAAALKAKVKKALGYMNQTHPYVGVLAVATVFAHCYFISNMMKNPLLWGLLGVVAWQGTFGALLAFKYTPKAIKRHSYMLHTQIVTGFIILITVILGHMVMGD